MEGYAPFAIPAANKPCATWYKVYGTLSSSVTPLIGLHGGPGAGHEYMTPLADLWNDHQIPVILYDQIGCGRSTELKEKAGDEAFWTEQLFRDEIDNLVRHLGIKRFDILGHSWGGMLAAKYASSHRSGLRKLILMGAPASVDLVLQGSAELRRTMPQDLQDIMEKYNSSGEFENPDYKRACLEFYKRFLCRNDPWPADLVTSMGHLEEDPTVYKTMRVLFGPSELICTGNLKAWTAIPDAHKIKQPTLLINGEDDETTAAATLPFFAGIPDVQWVKLSKSSHMGMWEERERFVAVVNSFLNDDMI